jgi:hypothetical protein
LNVKKPSDEASEARVGERPAPRPRKITLNLEAVPLRLPGEEQGSSISQEGLTSVAGATSEDAHLDAWNVDRVVRSSFPPSAPVSLTGLSPVAESEAYAPATEAEDNEGDVLELVGRKSRPTPSLDLMSEMSERFALGDFSGCLRAAELLLGQHPEHELARHYAQESRQKLESLFVSRLTAHGRVPKLAVRESEVRWLGLDSRMGFLLSRIDGSSDYETIVELSGMPRLEALRCLIDLADAKVIRIV